jgi:hypothetical protein
MNAAQWLLIGSVAAVGVLHTMVPDHWLPIAVMARQRNWSRGQTTRAAFGAGTGHVVSTLVIAVIFWAAGAAVATRFGQWVEIITSAALVGFGLWVAIGAILEMKGHHSHDDAEHPHHHDEKTGSRMTLLLILGSSPMVEGIPPFFAAGQYGIGLLVVMAVIFAAATIITYVVLSVYSAAGAQHLWFGRFEQYGEIASGLIIAAVGAVFWIWPLSITH